MEGGAAPMQVSLREVTVENWQHICKLQVADDQQAFVAPNWHSLLLATYGSPGDLADLMYVPLAIYAADSLVGLTVYNASPERDRFFIVRLMIDRAAQGQGYGRAALEALIARFKEFPQAREAGISYIPGNQIAGGLYRRLGFEDVGLDEDGREMIAVLDLNPQSEPWESLWRKK
jgi:diamine N-acetyltransferase